MGTTLSALQDLNDGQFQQLASELLKTMDPAWKDVVHSGAVEGTPKTRKGAPDLWTKINETRMVYFEVTTDRRKGKVRKDLEKLLPRLARESVPEKEFVAFLSFEPQRPEIQKCEELCQRSGVSFTLIHGSTVADALDLRQNHKIRAEYLKIPPKYDVFMTPEQFDEMRLRNVKLKQPSQLVGRGKDVLSIIEETQKGTQLIVVEGEPGVGKTRLCIEAAKQLVQLPRFYEYEVRVLPNTAKEIQDAVRTELDSQKRYIVIADDANRIGQISELFQLVTHPDHVQGSILLLNTRSYSSHDVMAQVRGSGIGQSARITVERLSNAEIHDIISRAPFNIKTQRVRKNIVQLSAGNPRMAAIVATLASGGTEIAGMDKPTLYREYFEEVFGEVASLLGTNKDRILLAHIAALRSVDFDNPPLVDVLCKTVGFSNQLELLDAAQRLVEHEIVDLMPSRTIKVFNDSISEYIVFRDFLDDKLGLLDLKVLMDSFPRNHPKKIVENIAALTSTGYKSKRMEKLLAEMTREFEQLVRQGDRDNCSEKLELLALVASSAPDECHRVTKEYVDKIGVENLSLTETELTVEVEKKALYAGWDHLLYPTMDLLSTIHKRSMESAKQIKSKVNEILTSAIRYLPPVQVDEKRYRWFYGPQLEFVGAIERMLGQSKDDNDLDLYAELLEKLCVHHFDSHESDYLDDMKIVMWAGPLHLTTQLEEIRRRAFGLLCEIYEMSTEKPARRARIIKAYEKAFHRLLPFGKSPSAALMSFDAQEILPYLRKLVRKEKHFLLRERIHSCLRSMEGIIKREELKSVRESMETSDLKLFQKMNLSYWEWREMRAKNLEKLEEERAGFFRAFADAFSQRNLRARLSRLSSFHLDALLEKQKMVGIERVFFELGRRSPQFAEEIVGIVETEFPSLLVYLKDLISGIGVSAPKVKLGIAIKWIDLGHVEKLRLLAATYAWLQEGNEQDKNVLNALLLINDPEVDYYLVSSIRQIESVDRHWVASSLVTLSERIDQRSYGELLMKLEPSEGERGFHYHLLQYDANAFKRILMNSARFGRIDEHSMGYHLSRCIEAVFNDDPGFLFEYYERRLQSRRSLTPEEALWYEVLPIHSLDLSFVKQHPQYSVLLERLLGMIENAGEDLLQPLQFLGCILGQKHVVWGDEEEIVLDGATLQVFEEWLRHSETRYKTVLAVCRHSFSPSWLPLLSALIRCAPAEVSLDDLIGLSIPHFWSGKRSVAIQSRLDRIRGLLREDKDSRVQRFLANADRVLDNAIETERERESREGR